MLPRLMLVLMCVACVAATACQEYTTGLQKGVTAADDTAALAALKAIGLAERNYNVSNAGEYGTLQQLTQANLLDKRFMSNKPVKDYVFTLNVIAKAPGGADGSYTCNVDPDPSGPPGGKHFYLDSTSTEIHVNASQAATATDPTLQ
jgi:Tfp pilus assembly protein PilE